MTADLTRRDAAFAQHAREQRRREAALTWAEKLRWLDEAQQLAIDLRRAPRTSAPRA